MDIIMPKMGESVNEGTIIKWHKKVGDSVKQDEIIFEISTDKVDTEIPSPAEGILKEIKFKEGDTVEVGTVVAIVDGNGESTSVDDSANDAVEESKEESLTSSKEEPKQESASSGDVVEIEMPKMGESVMEGTIIKWYKKVGDKVSKDETIFEISTDKVDTEIPHRLKAHFRKYLLANRKLLRLVLL